MSMLDSLFKQRFNAAKCKTLLKLTIPRIKLLRNRREIQLKQMRREIAKLLETGQEATARIRVEHIIREEKMMAAQEIVELFCELIAVRLPIIEAQRECPLDLKEAISSVCFAAPRCADLPELQQVQMLFAGKYSKEFVAAATELMPECGVNRQLVELLSIRAPAPDVKLKLLKEIAVEHELEWDPSATESELLKPHEDLLNGPSQFVSGSKLPLPSEKLDETIHTASEPATQEDTTSDGDFDIIDFPEVPKQPLQSNKPEMLHFPASALSDSDDEEEEHNPYGGNRNPLHLDPENVVQDKPIKKEDTFSQISAEEKQFVPFISSPSQSSSSFTVARHNSPPPISKSRFENFDLQDGLAAAQAAADSAERAAASARSAASISSFPVARHNSPPPTSKSRYENSDLQDVLAAAQAAADSAERAAASARSAASIAQLRISELMNRRNDEASAPTLVEKTGLDKHNSIGDSDSASTSPYQNDGYEAYMPHQPTAHPSYYDPTVGIDSSSPGNSFGSGHHQPQRLPSLDDDPYFSYPNLFTTQGSNLSNHEQSSADSK